MRQTGHNGKSAKMAENDIVVVLIGVIVNGSLPPVADNVTTNTPKANA